MLKYQLNPTRTVGEEAFWKCGQTSWRPDRQTRKSTLRAAKAERSRTNNFILYSGAIWRKLNNNKQHCGITVSWTYVPANKNAERLQVQSTSIVDFELDLLVSLFNKHNRYVRRYTGLRFQGNAAIHRYFCQETIVATVAMHFLVLAETWNVYSSEQSPEALPHRIQIIRCSALQG